MKTLSKHLRYLYKYSIKYTSVQIQKADVSHFQFHLQCVILRYGFSDNVPGRQLSGVSDEVVTAEINNRYVKEYGKLFNNYLTEQEESSTNVNIPEEIEIMK